MSDSKSESSGVCPACGQEMHSSQIEKWIDYAWKVNIDLLDNVKFADTKGAFALTIIIGVTSALLIVVGARISENPNVLEDSGWCWTIIALATIYIAMALGGISFAVSVIRPRGYAASRIRLAWSETSLVQIEDHSLLTRMRDAVEACQLEPETDPICSNPEDAGLVGGVPIISMENRQAYETRLKCPQSRLSDLISRIGHQAWIDRQKYKAVENALILAAFSFLAAVALAATTIVASAKLPKGNSPNVNLIRLVP